VTTYVQSGNVVFKSKARSSAELTGAIEKPIRGDLDLNVTVLLRAAAQLAKIAAGNPFRQEWRGAEEASHHFPGRRT
jgi:uncharacterized protein (DUF1697 family)